MKAIETTAIINEQGQLVLAQPLDLAQGCQVRVIVLVSEEETALEPDNMPDIVIVESLRQGISEAIASPAVSLSQLQDGMDLT